jgi:hypothetical protein
VTNPRYLALLGRYLPPKCWRRIARLLARNGHEVFTPTLTPGSNLDTHILDVLNEMRWQE